MTGNNPWEERHTESKPGHEDSESVVQHLNVEEEHAKDVMSTLVHSAKVHESVDTGGERTIEPSTTLTDEFRSSFGNVGLTLGGFDVCKMPLGSSFGDKFETENTIFGQKHVFLEDVHALNTLGTELFGQRVASAGQTGISTDVRYVRCWPPKVRKTGRYIRQPCNSGGFGWMAPDLPAG